MVFAITLTASLASLYVKAEDAVKRVSLGGAQSLIGAPSPSIAVPRIPRVLIERAAAADPLSQPVFNGAMVTLGRRPGQSLPDAAWLNVLRRFGWRNITSLQNIMFCAAIKRQIAPALDAADALLRGGLVLEDTTTRVMMAAESNPTFHADIVARLSTMPSWRHLYMMKSATLADPASVEGRYQTLVTLQRSRAKPTNEELTAFLPALVRAGRTPDAFALWAAGRKGVERPLNDPHFVQAAIHFGEDDTANPFGWRLATGGNFDIAAGSDGLTIHWDGREAPVFASQQISEPAGTYRLQVNLDEGDPAALGYRLVCPDGTATEFAPVRSGDKSVPLETINPVACAFALFQIHGTSNAPRQDLTLRLTGFSLRRSG